MSLLDSITDNNRIRLAVCVPARDQMHTATAFCLWRLAKHLDSEGIESTLFVSPGTLIANQRHELVLSAMEWQATHLLFIDSDIEFEPHHATELLSKNKDIVAAAYSKRVPPFITTAWSDIDDWNTWIRMSEHDEDIIRVEAVALGFCLIKMSVFDRIKKPWFQLGYYNGEYTGEDIEFFRKARNAEIPAWLDLEVTKELGHLGTYSFKVDPDS